ncbi:hypothetical protein CI610_01863 [invertebrate metagenome]|uniref:Uncharacterized protein n=1 Tax=invertebrate metagenome TaxID=1711999 RepID=A0A2H9T7L2_9ZZZZ
MDQMTYYFSGHWLASREEYNKVRIMERGKKKGAGEQVFCVGETIQYMAFDREPD